MRVADCRRTSLADGDSRSGRVLDDGPLNGWMLEAMKPGTKAPGFAGLAAGGSLKGSLGVGPLAFGWAGHFVPCSVRVLWRFAIGIFVLTIVGGRVLPESRLVASMWLLPAWNGSRNPVPFQEISVARSAPKTDRISTQEPQAVCSVWLETRTAPVSSRYLGLEMAPSWQRVSATACCLLSRLLLSITWRVVVSWPLD